MSSKKRTAEYPLFKVSNPPPFQTIGLFTFLRTYARRHDENDPKSTIESWQECIERVVTSCNSQLKVGFTENELQEVFSLLYNLKCSVAGRFMWQLGTRTVDNLGLPSLQNCFRRDTEFWTKEGIKTFRDFNDGDQVTILGKNDWMPATVKNFGQQQLFKLTHKYNIVDTKEIFTTSNHRWLVKGAGGDLVEVTTTNLKPGDELAKCENFNIGRFTQNFIVESVQETQYVEDVWCVVEPVYEIFALGDGILTKNCAFSVIDDPVRPFTWAMDMLMLGCVPPETKIVTENGITQIKDIKIGDRVWSFNTENNTKELKTVTALHDPIVHKSENVKFTTSREGSFISSKNHPILTLDVNNNWIYIKAGELKIGNIVQSFMYPRIKPEYNKDIWYVGMNVGNRLELGQYLDIPNYIKENTNSNVFFSFLFGLFDSKCTGVDAPNGSVLCRANDKLREFLLSRCPLFGVYPTIEGDFVDFYAGDFRAIYGFDSYISFLQSTDPQKRYCFESKSDSSYGEDPIYGRILDIKYDLDISENWKDLTVEDNNNYFCGEGNYYCTHNCGVGYRLLPEDVAKLPVVKYALVTRKDTKDADYIVPDSREGWVKLLGKVLKAHFYSGQNFTYSCTLLRSKGAPIKSFGGLASGPEVLCDGLEKISGILNKRVGQKIRSVDALDIMNIIGMIVVSGNV